MSSHERKASLSYVPPNRSHDPEARNGAVQKEEKGGIYPEVRVLAHDWS